MTISVEVASFASAMDVLHTRNVDATALIALKLTTATPVISAEDVAELERVRAQAEADVVANEALAAPVIPSPVP